MAGLGLRAPPDATASATDSAAPASTPTTEVIHTTANHPWLSADHGWLLAGDLHIGESVRLLDGGTATVVALQALPGVGAMWDLTLDDVHTFAVGDAPCGRQLTSADLLWLVNSITTRLWSLKK